MLLSITKNQIYVKHFPIHYTFKEGEMDKLWKKHFIFATKNNIDISNCHTQACNGGSAMSRHRCGAV